jgi:hypothetical protein
VSHRAAVWFQLRQLERVSPLADARHARCGDCRRRNSALGLSLLTARTDRCYSVPWHSPDCFPGSAQLCWRLVE